MGIGDGVIPKVLNQKIYEHIAIITDEEALKTAKDLSRLEGLMCGISSGTNVAAAIRLAGELGKRKDCCHSTSRHSRTLFFNPII